MVGQLLATAGLVSASDLTLIECDRALHRATREDRIAEGDAAARRATLARAASHWVLLRIGPEVVERARRPFPLEPVRTLDALHIATALVVRGAIADTDLLSLDDRVRACGTALGFRILPQP